MIFVVVIFLFINDISNQLLLSLYILDMLLYAMKIKLSCHSHLLHFQDDVFNLFQFCEIIFDFILKFVMRAASQ